MTSCWLGSILALHFFLGRLPHLSLYWSSAGEATADCFVEDVDPSFPITSKALFVFDCAALNPPADATATSATVASPAASPNRIFGRNQRSSRPARAASTRMNAGGAVLRRARRTLSSSASPSSRFQNRLTSCPPKPRSQCQPEYARSGTKPYDGFPPWIATLSASEALESEERLSIRSRSRTSARWSATSTAFVRMPRISPIRRAVKSAP